MSETCTCGDVLDEHDDGDECTVDGCPCIAFEAAEEDEDEDE